MDINGESSSSASSGFKLFGKTIVASEKDGQDQDQDDSITIADHEETTSKSEESSENSTTATKKTTTSTTTKRGGHLPCPRCKSKETKFCYFNNYNVNQPRHFCKACHRYWTAGGALRNVPVGAGRRKNRTLPSGGSSGDEEEEVERWLIS